MKRFFLLLSLFFSACPSSPSHNGLGIDVKPGAVWLDLNGIPIGPIYVIGACPGFLDDPATNVSSIDSDGHTLLSGSPTKCPGSPFSFVASRTGSGSFHLSVSVGPLAADYSQLSIPHDPPNKTIFTQFQFGPGVAEYWAGCGGVWDHITGAAGTFEAIPTPCPLPVLHAFVGIATDRNPTTLAVPQVMWFEANDGRTKVHRSFTAGMHDIEEVSFINHPATNNDTAAFGFVHKGQTVRDEEDVAVF